MKSSEILRCVRKEKMNELDIIKGDLAALQARIAAFEAASHPQPALAFPLTIAPPELNPGETYIGLVASADGQRAHHLILLAEHGNELDWDAAKVWAEEQGGELPDRVESALLYAHAKDQFKPEWYWTREKYNDDYAWAQFFGGGFQNYRHAYYEFRACAVRRLPI